MILNNDHFKKFFIDSVKQLAKFLLKQTALLFFLSRIRYGPGWSAKTQKMGYSVCLAPELSYIDSSRQFWPAESHVTNESANQTLSTAMTHSQISDREQSIRPQMNPCTSINWARVHGLMNLALRMRYRRDITGPRSPLTPLRLTGE